MSSSVILSKRAQAKLRSLAHALDPVVQVGEQGLTPGVLEAVEVALEDHELIKVRLGKAYEGDRHAAGRELAEALGAACPQVIGRIVVLYRPRRRPRGPKDRPAIELPA